MRVVPAFAVLLLALPLSAQREPKRIKPLNPDSRADMIVNERDPFTGVRHHITTASTLSPGCNSGILATMLELECPGTVDVMWSRAIRPAGDTLFSLMVAYCGRDWIFIRPDSGSLVFLLDNMPMNFTPSEKPTTDVGTCYLPGKGVTVIETASFPVTPLQLFAIIHADHIRWRLYGSKGYRQGDADPTNFRKLRRFLALLYPDSLIYDKTAVR